MVVQNQDVTFVTKDITFVTVVTFVNSLVTLVTSTSTCNFNVQINLLAKFFSQRFFSVIFPDLFLSIKF